MIVYVSLVWLGAACISLPPLLIMGNEHSYSENTGASHCVVCQNFFYQIYATLGSFYLPLIVMIQVSMPGLVHFHLSLFSFFYLFVLIICTLLFEIALKIPFVEYHFSIFNVYTCIKNHYTVSVNTY